MEHILPSFLNKRMTYNTILKLGAEVVGRAATFLLLLLAARWLSADQFGLYNYGLALGFVLVQITDFGLQLLITRQVARHGPRARNQVIAAFHVKLWLSLPVLVLLWLFTADQPFALRASLLAIGVTLLLQTFLEYIAYVFRGQQRLSVEVSLLTTVRLLTAVFGGILLWQNGRLAGLALAGLLATAVMVVIGLRQLRAAGWISRYRQLVPRRLPLGSDHRRLWQQTWPLGIAIFLSIAYTRLAILLLQAQADATAVAHYSAAYRLVEPTQILPASLLAAVFPAFAHALTHDQQRVWPLGAQTTLLLALAGASVAAFYWLSADWLIPLLYGAPFRASVPVFRLLGVSIIPVYINYSLTHYLIARGQQAYLTGLTAVTLTLHAALCWQLIPRWGIVGPAVSVLAVECVLMAGCLLVLTTTVPVEVPA